MVGLCARGVFFVLVVLAAVVGAAERPNVVVVLTDDQGTMDANCFGSTDLHTPAIDRLARRGIRFTQAYAHTVCCPARAALMTGRHPQRSSVNSWTQRDITQESGINMHLEEVTLAETLKAAGYQTALFGKWHLGAHRDFGPTRQGFDHFFGIRDGFIDNYNHYWLHRDGFHDLFEGTREVWADGQYFPQMVIDRALAYVEENKERPFFLYLALNTPHYPEQALEQHAERYANLPMPRRSYAAFVTTTDHYIGLLMEKLADLGIADDTIVIFMSDNGHSAEQYAIREDVHASGYKKGHNYGANGGGGNTGKWLGNKNTFLEGGIRVPAVLTYPKRVPQGEVRDQAISIMDWYPTLLTLCGINSPPVTFDGHDLQPIIESASAPSPHEVLYFQWQDRWAVRRGDWKLIGRDPRNGRAAQLSLHNLADAEPEKENYLERQPEIVQQLQALHDAWAEDVFGDGGP